MHPPHPNPTQEIYSA